MLFPYVHEFPSFTIVSSGLSPVQGVTIDRTLNMDVASVMLPVNEGGWQTQTKARKSKHVFSLKLLKHHAQATTPCEKKANFWGVLNIFTTEIQMKSKHLLTEKILITKCFEGLLVQLRTSHSYSEPTTN